MPNNKENISENRFAVHTRVENDNEILGKMPSWIIRYGMALSGAILLLLFTVFILYKMPYNISMRGNFYSKSEVSQSRLLTNLCLKTIDESIPGKELPGNLFFIGEYLNEHKLIKAGQHATIKYVERSEIAYTKNIILKKVYNDTINKKTVILFDNIKVDNRDKLLGIEIEIAKKNIFQLLF
ncbi:MAG: hypothetical protein QM737_19375 [Ferruginibacter sp.]